jgi:hypothetical protein
VAHRKVNPDEVTRRCQPRRPARSWRDLGRGVRGEEDRPALAPGSNPARRPQITRAGGGYHTRDPCVGAVWTSINSSQPSS